MDASRHQQFDMRPLGRADAEPWRRLRLRALKEHPLSFTSSYEEFAATPPEEVAARLPEPGGPDVLFGLFLDDALVGCAGFTAMRPRKLRHKGVMWGVYVEPGVRRRGGGSRLVAEVIEHARAHVDVLQAAVVAGNARARSVYERAGFRSYGVEPRCIRLDGVDYDEELLWMPLDQAPASLQGVAISDRRAP